MGSEPHVAEVSEDAFLGGALTLVQPRAGHRGGLDAVLLAASVPATPGDTVLDLGAGVGTAGLAVLARVPDTRALLVERDARPMTLAARNVAANGMDERAEVLCRDIEAPGGAQGAGIDQGSVDHALANPPFFSAGEMRASPDAGRSDAHVHDRGRSEGLERWCAFAAGAVRSGGTLTLIHRADALPDVLEAMDGRFGGVRVTPVHPRPGEDAIRVLVQGAKGSRAPLVIAPALILHGPSGSAFAPPIEAVLRAPKAL